MTARALQAAVPGLLLLAFFACDSVSSDSGSDSPGTTAPIQQRGVVPIGALAPNFELWDLDGNPITLLQHRGKVVLINFWATWCGPCRVEMPAMEALYRGISRKDFEILAVSTDAQGAAVTRPFKESLGLTFPILHDSDYRIGVTYGARTLPISFMVNRQGVVTHRIFGARDWNSPEARNMLLALLKGPIQ